MRTGHGKWAILSYPRSGNHILRTFVEYAASRPTLGCPYSPKDNPIHARLPNFSKQIIQITDNDPIAVKAHTALDLWRHEMDWDIVSVVLVARDPVECVSSHLARSLRKKWFLTEKSIDRAVDAELANYLSVLSLFKNFSPAQRFHVLFKEMVGEEPNTGKISDIISRMSGKSVNFGANDVDNVRALSLASQESLKDKNATLKAKIKAKVAEKISYQDVMSYLMT